MRFENQFAVAAPIEEVWAALLDVERVAPTVPGAQVLERIGDDAYKVAIKVKVGPMSMTYRGEVEITERDEAAHRAVMKARAKESRGQGMADADVTMVLSGDDGRTSATVTTEVELSGKVATMGQGVLQDVSGRLVRTFADNLAAMLEGGGEAEPGAGAPSGAGGEAGAPSLAGGAVAGGAAPGSAPATIAGTPATPAVQAKSPAELASAQAGAARPAAAGDRTRPAPAPQADALDLGSIGGAVVADRLRDPRLLAGLLAAVALVFFWLGRRSGGG